jgi:hypothetical protein
VGSLKSVAPRVEAHFDEVLLQPYPHPYPIRVKVESIVTDFDEFIVAGWVMRSAQWLNRGESVRHPRALENAFAQIPWLRSAYKIHGDSVAFPGLHSNLSTLYKGAAGPLHGSFQFIGSFPTRGFINHLFFIPSNLVENSSLLRPRLEYTFYCRNIFNAADAQ